MYLAFQYMSSCAFLISQSRYFKQFRCTIHQGLCRIAVEHLRFDEEFLDITGLIDKIDSTCSPV